MTSDADTLDLHGFTVEEAIERFVGHYNARVKHRQLRCLKIVHGYGSSGKGGLMRTKLRSFLDRYPDRLRYEPGDNYGNPGWTHVYPKLALPYRRERLVAEMLEYCSIPRVEEKILSEFAQVNGLQVKEALRSLVKHGELRRIVTAAKVQYQSNPPAPSNPPG